jgi:hypothetical protein
MALAFVIVRTRRGGLGAYSLFDDRVLVTCAGCVVFGTAAWCASPSIPGGDEPHYLIITESLLHDHDLDIQNNYASGDYHAYFGGTLNPDFHAPGRHGEIYSIHAPGVPALVLPAFAIGGYRGVVAFLILLSACACTLAWWLAWRATGSRTAAWFGWAAVVCTAPFLLESFTVYPDGPGAGLVLTGFWALQRLDREERLSARALMLHGAALAALPWMHTRFVLLAGVLGLWILIRLMRDGVVARAGAFLIVPIVSAVAWLASFYVMYGTANPSAPYGGVSNSALAFLPNGAAAQTVRSGIRPGDHAPCSPSPFSVLARRLLAVEWGRRRLYGAAVGAYAMGWAGSSGPARFLVPVILPLAIPAACAWQAASSRGARAVMVMALLVSAWLAFVMAAGGGGFLGYHGRNVYGLTAAPWLAWANSLVDLSQALPAFVPLPSGTPLGARITAARVGFEAAVPWIVCASLAGFVALRFGRRREATWPALIASATIAFASAAMIASSIVWWMHGARPLTPVPAQLDVLRRFADGGTLAFDLVNARRIRNVSEMNMRIDMPVEPGDASPATLASIPALPAGSYTVSGRGMPHQASVYAGSDDRAVRPHHGEGGCTRASDRSSGAVRALTIRRDGRGLARSSCGPPGLKTRNLGGAGVCQARRRLRDNERVLPGRSNDARGGRLLGVGRARRCGPVRSTSVRSPADAAQRRGAERRDDPGRKPRAARDPAAW